VRDYTRRAEFIQSYSIIALYLYRATLDQICHALNDPKLDVHIVFKYYMPTFVYYP